MQTSLKDIAHENLVSAVPSAPEPFLTTMEIWHRAPWPKPAYTTARNILRDWAASGCGLVRQGGRAGAQRYRYDDSLMVGVRFRLSDAYLEELRRAKLAVSAATNPASALGQGLSYPHQRDTK